MITLDSLNYDNSFSVESKFNDVINEIRTKKIELFGDPEENMDFYKRNRNVFDSRILERSYKIAKILELEELLQFYLNQNNSNLKKLKTRQEPEKNHKNNLDTIKVREMSLNNSDKENSTRRSYVSNKNLRKIIFQ
jgi:hypothetical protein